MRLEIDIGNTRIKWRLTDYEHQQVADGVGLLTDLSGYQAFDSLFGAIDLSLINHIAVASVVPSLHPLLSQWCDKKAVPPPVFAEVTRECVGVVNAYRDVSQMGVDRWLALLAAYDRCGGSVVVSAGSAVTVDLVRQDGLHLGGYIVPGLRLLAEGLLHNTDQVNIVSQEYQERLDPGVSTTEAVMRGLPLMLIGLILGACAQLQRDGELSPSVVISGGDGEYLLSLMEANGLRRGKYIPSLVFEGLQLALGQEIP
jgi:type III pantothenate kinase